MAEVKEQEHWTKVIKSEHKLLDLHLRDVYRYRDLIKMFVKRDFVVQYKQTVLGPLWYLLQPVLSSMVYIFIFGNLANIGTDGIPPLLFYFGGTMFWTYFTSCLTETSNVFVNQQHIFSKVYFPRLTVPISIALGLIVKLLIQGVLLVGFYVYFVANGSAVRPTIFALLVPFLIFWIGALGSSIGLIISSLTTKYRDLRLLVSFGLQLAMYATPVVYPLSEAPKKFFWVFYANPMSAPMELFRMFVYGEGSLPNDMLLVSLGVSAFCFLFGLILFVKNERSFVDVI
ncbi:MAG: ABC transporter permease [Treponema sp.]|nr:ABC transporter permease [Treponema sp.]